MSHSCDLIEEIWLPILSCPLSTERLVFIISTLCFQNLCFTMYVCGIHVCMYVGIAVGGVQMHVWMPEAHIRDLPQFLPTLFTEARSSTEPGIHSVSPALGLQEYLAFDLGAGGLNLSPHIYAASTLLNG